MPTELDLKNEIHDRLKVCQKRGLRLWFVKIHGHGMQRPGIPDYLICLEGRFVAVELKRPGENPTPIQTLEMRAILAARGYATVAYSWQDFCEKLNLPDWCLSVPRK